MKSYTVIGLGRFGSCMAEKLYEMGCDVLAIDHNEELVQRVADHVTRAVTADSGDIEVLRALGVQNCDCAVVAIGTDLAAAVLAVMNLQELGVTDIVCKAQNDAYRRVLEKLGASRVIIPEHEVAERLAHSLCSPNVLDFIELSEDYGIVEVPAPKMWLEKSIRELNVRAKLGVNIIAVKKGEHIDVAPAADYVIRKGDIMVVLGDYEALSRVEKL